MTVLSINNPEHIVEILRCLLDIEDRIILIEGKNMKNIVGHSISITYRLEPPKIDLLGEVKLTDVCSHMPVEAESWKIRPNQRSKRNY